MPEAAELEKTPKKAVKPKTLKAYVLNKSLIGYGVINGVINGLIAYFINIGNPSAYFEWTNVLFDFALTGLLLGAILAACVLPMTRKDVRNGIVILPTALTGWRTRMPKAPLPPSSSVVSWGCAHAPHRRHSAPRVRPYVTHGFRVLQGRLLCAPRCAHGVSLHLQGHSGKCQIGGRASEPDNLSLDFQRHPASARAGQWEQG